MIFVGFVWRDIIEILFFAAAVDLFCSWLTADSRTPLLYCFYSYCALTGVTLWLQLTTISLFLLGGAPCILLLFIIFHQRSLQKNFVTALRSIQPTHTPSLAWIDLVLQGTLKALNHGISVHILIERTDSCELLLSDKIPVNAQLSSELLELIITNPMYDSTTLIVINTSGSLVCINAQFHTSSQLVTTVEEMHRQQKETAQLISRTSDLLILSTQSKNRTFEIICAGTNHTNLSAENIRKCLRHWSTGQKNIFPQGAPHVYDRQTHHRPSNQP